MHEVWLLDYSPIDDWAMRRRIGEALVGGRAIGARSAPRRDSPPDGPLSISAAARSVAAPPEFSMPISDLW